MSSSTDSKSSYGSLTVVGRSLPIASSLGPRIQLLLQLLFKTPLVQAIVRRWKLSLVSVIAALAGRKVYKDRLAKAKQLAAIPKATPAKSGGPASEHKPVKPEPTPPKPPDWLQILADPASGMVSGRVELVGVALTTFLVALLSLGRHKIQGLFYVAQNALDRQLMGKLLVVLPTLVITTNLLDKGNEILKARVALNWRRTVTYKLHDEYFSFRAYYHVLNQPSNLAISDPDVRICNDVKDACNSVAAVITSSLTAAIYTLVMYSDAMSRISFKFVMVPPVFMVMFIPSILKATFPPQLGWLWGRTQAATAAYKQSLTRVQLHAPRICMLQGEDFEYEILQKSINNIQSSLQAVIAVCNSKDFAETLLFGGRFPSMFQGMATFTSAAIVANELGRDGAASTGPLDPHAPRHDVARRFGNYIQNWWSVSTCAGLLTSVHTAMSAMDRIRASFLRIQELFVRFSMVKASTPEVVGTFEEGGAVVAFKDVSVVTPLGAKLLSGLTFEVKEGDPLLICGHNGAGKSSIIRCLGALWPIPQGRIARPCTTLLAQEVDANAAMHSELYYLPQKPVSVLGSLSDQITYPVQVPGGLPEHELRCWLRCVDMEYLMERNGAASVDWEEQLSLGEQQALGIARLFYHCPRFAILDECTSALSRRLERRLFELVPRVGITCITITHRPALQEYHGRMLKLTGHFDSDSRGWDMSDLDHRNTLPTLQPRPASQIEVQNSILEHLDRPSSIDSKAELTKSTDASTAKVVKKPSATDMVTARWTSSPGRFLAVARLALQEPGSSSKAAWRLLVMVAGMRLHCSLLWEIWSCSMGAITSGLTGNSPGILAELLANLLWSTVISVVDVVVKRQSTELASELGASAGRELLRMAFKNSSFYHVMQSAGAQVPHVESPMQRVAEVQDHFHAIADQLLEVTFRSAVGLYYLPTFLRGVGPGGFAFLASYFAVFRFCLLFAPDFSKLERQLKELDMRFQGLHTRLRHIAEPVAFSSGGAAERHMIETRFEETQAFHLHTLRSEFMHKVITSLFADHSGLPLWLQRMMGQVFHRANVPPSSATLGVSPAVGVQGFLFERAIMYTETMAQRIGNFVPQWRRLDGGNLRILEVVVAFESAAESAASAHANNLAAAAAANALDQQSLIVAGLDIMTPAGEYLARDLNFSVHQGKPLLVTGPNASGKSLLGSILLGMSPTVGHGASVRVPFATSTGRAPLEVLMPAPQRVYLPPGTLGNQVCYPSQHDPKSENAGEQEAKMLQALQAMGIEYLFTREETGWAASRVWEHVLSGGEQQRLGLARIAFRAPSFALLDECTSMVAQDAEAGLYKALVNDFGVTPITLTQRLFLPEIHAKELSLGATSSKGWSLSDVT